MWQLKNKSIILLFANILNLINCHLYTTWREDFPILLWSNKNQIIRNYDDMLNARVTYLLKKGDGGE